jgi:uncharacterized protein involved in exopolysaccharide biosynthesis
MIEQKIEEIQSLYSVGEPILVEEKRTTPGLALLNFLSELAHKKKLAGILAGLGLLLGAIYSLVLPNLYTSTTSIMPPQQTQSSAALLMSQLASSGAGSLAAAAAGGGFGLKDPNAIYIGLLKSRPISETIIDRFGLVEVYRSKDRTGARLELEKNTQIASERSGLISVSVTDKDRDRAAQIANTYTEQLRFLTKTISVTEASRRRLFFEEQLKQAKQDLEAAENSLQQVQQTHGLVHLDTQANAMITSMAKLRGEIESKKVELQAMRSFSTDRNPSVQLVERELAALESEAAQMEHNDSSSNFSEMGIKDVSRAGLDYVRAQREYTYRQMFFDLLQRQYEAARLDEARDATVIQIVEPAVSPERKSAPPRASQILVSTFLGFLSACLWVYLVGFLEKNREFAQSLAQLGSAIVRK